MVEIPLLDLAQFLFVLFDGLLQAHERQVAYQHRVFLSIDSFLNFAAFFHESAPLIVVTDQRRLRLAYLVVNLAVLVSDFRA